MRLALAFVFLTAACAALPPASEEDRMLPFECDDTVVIGRVVNGAYQHVENENDILGHGWISATLKVRKVIKRPTLPSKIPVRYFAHTFMRDDRDFMFVLDHTKTGYEIVTGQLMSARPFLERSCE